MTDASLKTKSERATQRDRAAAVARLFALRAARATNLDLDSIEGWVHASMKADGDGDRESAALAAETGLPEAEVRSLIAGSLRRYYVARRMAALPPALRDIAIRCQDPSVPVLLGLMERMDPEHRGGMDPIRATRRVYVIAKAQAVIQRERYAVTAAVAAQVA